MILHEIDLADKDKLFTPASYQDSRAPSKFSNKLQKRRVRLTVRANTFSYRIIDSWKKLSENVVSAPSVKFEATHYQTSLPTRGICQNYQQASDSDVEYGELW